MAIRAIEDDVRSLLEDTDYACSVFITQANIIVNEFLAPGGSSDLSDDLLKVIETYLAAHFVVLAKERGALQEDKMGDASQKYHNVYSAGFNSTRFGQQALMFDTTGALANVSNQAANPGTKKALFGVISTLQPRNSVYEGGTP